MNLNSLKENTLKTAICVFLLGLLIVPLRQFELTTRSPSWIKVCVCALMLVWSLYLIRRRVSEFSSELVLVLCPWAAATFCLSFELLKPSVRHDSVVAMALYLLAGIICGILISGKSTIRLLLGLALIQSSVVLYQAVTKTGAVYSADMLRPGGTLGLPQVASLVLACSFSLAVAELKGIQGIFPWIRVLFIGSALILTWSRIACLAGAIGAVSTLYGSFKEIRQPKQLLTGLIVLSCLSSPFFMRVSSFERAQSTSRANSSRIQQWKQAVRLIWSRPEGLGAGGVSFPISAKLSDGRSGIVQAVDTKNQFLQIFAAFGVIGGIVAVIYCAMLCLTLCALDTIDRPGLLGVFITLGVFLLVDTAFFVVGREVLTGLLGLFSSLLLRVSRDGS